MSLSLHDQIMKDLNAPRGRGIDAGMDTFLHAMQVDILKPIITEETRMVFAACSRKLGKSTSAMYLAWYWALTRPNSSVYLACPESTHAKKIYWNDGKIYAFLGKETAKYVDGKPNSRELIIKLKNGSFIQLIGSENYMAANGLTPSLVIYDEFKGFHPQFHIEMNPNRVALGAPLLVIGTLADGGAKNREQYNNLLSFCENSKGKYPVFKLSTFDNPLNCVEPYKSAIEEEIEILRADGAEDVVQREYFSKIIPGGKRAIFPHWNEELTMSREDIVKELAFNKSKMTYWVAMDPGTTTCFAVLLGCYDPYSGKMYILDEVYVKRQEDSVISKVIPQVMSKMLEWYPEGDISDDWYKVCDEAGAWAIMETISQFPGMAFMATNKNVNKKENGLNIIKESMKRKLWIVNNECINYIKEVEGYQLTKNNTIPKVDDHLQDCSRYAVGLLNYSFIPLDSTSDEDRVYFNLDDRLAGLDSEYDLDFPSDW